MDLELPTGFRARAYRGPEDHATMAGLLGAYHRHHSDGEQPTAEQFDSTYANLDNCDPRRDAVLIERDDGTPVGYARANWEEQADRTVWVPFAVLHPDHITADLYTAVIAGMEKHLGTLPEIAAGIDGYLAFAPHPGPGLPAAGEAAWLESLGYRPEHFSASLVRPDLDAIPEVTLPDGVVIRPVEPDQIRLIWDAHQECFRGQWDFQEPTENAFQAFFADPRRDESLWKVAWAGDEVVGQVKTYVLEDENQAEGRRRGYTEEISTHSDWRGRGIAGALLCESLRELRRRGYTEAALGADTDNPSAFGLYQRVGFIVTAYEAAYAKPLSQSG